MLKLSPTSLSCTLLVLWCIQGCWGAVKVTVTPVVEVMKGGSVTLPCSFSVSEPSSNSIVEWYIDEGEDSRKRVAYRPASGPGGKVDVDTRLTGRVTAGAAGVGQGATELKVFFAPEKPEVKLSNEVISVTDSSSSEVGQCVSRNGHPLPHIIWYKDLNALPQVSDSSAEMYMVNSMVKEASGLLTVYSTLYLKAKKEDKDSHFHCRVEYNTTGGVVATKDSEPFTLPLHYPTEHVTFSLVSSEPIKEGDDVVLKCDSDAYPQPDFDFSFLTGGTPLQGAAGLLTLNSVTRGNTGTYKCEVLDFDAEEDVVLEKQLELFIHYLNPVVITPAGPVSQPLGGSVELHCKTKASDKHTLHWKKGSTVLSQNGVLSLKSVSFADAGEYSCVAAVPSVPGLHAQANVTLTVTGKPEIEAPSEAFVQKEGDTVTLMCSVQGHPAPQFTWTPSGKQSVEVKGNAVISTVMLEATGAVLRDGVTCQAGNVHGTDSQQFKVSISKDIPSDNSDNGATDRAERQQGGSSGVVIAVVVCVLLLLLLVAILYFMQKKGKLSCGKQDKKDVTTGEVNNDIVVEMKSEKANEEAGLLNKRPVTEQ
ncbi:hypothetical protein ANANG_G00005540 [Anguilla anguilla]|uniref:Ig-like domain-containing protein n=1 Tax=Anguilla anguilla TaxID=7936 RepID=A0A9D3MWN6_ANGAN|nr:hypothetical protein ANANG_G00005540 [Anguilla anguilla]